MDDPDMAVKLHRKGRAGNHFAKIKYQQIGGVVNEQSGIDPIEAFQILHFFFHNFVQQQGVSRQGQNNDEQRLNSEGIRIESVEGLNKQGIENRETGKGNAQAGHNFGVDVVLRHNLVKPGKA